MTPSRTVTWATLSGGAVWCGHNWGMSERAFPGGGVRGSRGGVAVAIPRAGGPEIMAETQRRFPDGCPTGSAVTTSAGQLPARFVIHAVGPRWRGGGQGEDGQLASAWRSALCEAIEHQANSVAFPSLATGI